MKRYLAEEEVGITLTAKQWQSLLRADNKIAQDIDHKISTQLCDGESGFSFNFKENSVYHAINNSLKNRNETFESVGFEFENEHLVWKGKF